MKKWIPFFALAVLACNRSDEVLPVPDLTVLNALSDTSQAATIGLPAGNQVVAYGTVRPLPVSAGNQAVSIRRNAGDTLAQNFLLPVANGQRQLLVLADTGARRIPFYKFIDRNQGRGDTTRCFVRLLHLNPDTAFQNIGLYVNDTVPVDNGRRHADWLLVNNTQRATLSTYRAVPFGQRFWDLRRRADTASRFARQQLILLPGRHYTFLFSQRRVGGQPSFSVVED